MFRVGRFPALFSLLALWLPTAAAAAPAPVSSRAESRALLLRPLTLVRLANMDFATLALTTGDTATIDPLTGAMSVTGGLFHIGGTPSPARYAGAASKRTVVIIRVPNQPVLIRREGGTETLSVSNFTLDGQDKKALAEQESFAFAVGARITVPAGTAEGVYSGDIEVTVHYP